MSTPPPPAMKAEAERLLALADAIAASLPEGAPFLDSWRKHVRGWLTATKLETLEGERALETLALDLRYRWLVHAHGISDRIMMSPPHGEPKFLPNGTRMAYPYDRWLKPDFLEARLLAHRPAPRGWRADAVLLANGMAAIATFLQLYRTFAGRLWTRPRGPLSLHWFGGYFEITRALQLLCDSLFQGRQHATQDGLFTDIAQDRADLVLIEPVAADIGLEVFDLDGFIAAWKRRKGERPCVVVVDTSLTGHSFPIERLCAELTPNPPALVVQISSGLKLDQEGLELANAGLLTLMTPDNTDGAEKLETIGFSLRKARTTLGASLSQSEYAALSAPFFLDGRSLERHAQAVFANNAAFARAMAALVEPQGGLFTQVAHPALGGQKDRPWAQAPYVNLRYQGDGQGLEGTPGEEARDFLTRVLQREARRRKLCFQSGSSFGFRAHRFEMGFVRGVKHTSLRVAVGARPGPSLDGVVQLFRDLNAYPDFPALRAAYKEWAAKPSEPQAEKAGEEP